MPRVNQCRSEITRQKIIDSAFELLIESDDTKLTFTNIAKRAGIGRSGINVHFKRKQDLLNVLYPYALDIVLSSLDFSSPDAFFRSWKAILASNLHVQNIVKKSELFVTSKEALTLLMAKIPGDRNEAEAIILVAIGYSNILLKSK